MAISLRRGIACITAGIVSVSLITAFSVGLIGSSSSSATTRATAKKDPASSPAATGEGSSTDTAAETVVEPPYPIGTITVALVDTTRSTAARGSTPPSSTRTITVTISYPVTDSANQYPLVVFAHGYDVSAATYAAMEQEIAAAGFIVAAPDFPLSSSALDGEAERDAVEQATDVSFVITSLLNSATRPAELIGLIADTQVAVVGHSDGGITAAGVAYNDEYADTRIGAAVILSGAEAFFPGSWFTEQSPALLAVHGTADEVNPLGASEAIFSGATGSKWLVEVDGGVHLEPFTTDAVRPEISALIADFLRAELSGDSAAAARVDADANASGLILAAQS